MKLLRSGLLVLHPVLGYLGVAAILEGLPGTGVPLLLLAVLTEAVVRVLQLPAGAVLEYGSVLWYGSGAYFLLWRYALSESGVYGIAAGLLFFAAAFIWYSRNRVSASRHRGLPLWASSGIVMSLIAASGYAVVGDCSEGFCRPVILVSVILAYFMISDIPYAGFSGMRFNVWSWIFIAVSAVAVFFYGYFALFGLFGLYLFSGIYERLKRRWKN